MKIENLTNKPLWLRLNSGEPFVVGPRTLSAELPEHEIDGNPALEKLMQQRAVACQPSAIAAETAPVAPRRKERAE